MKTICKWMEEDEQILVNPDGQVLPCCYLSGYLAVDLTPQKNSNTWEWDAIRDQLYHKDLVHNSAREQYLYKEYDKRKNELNIFTNDLDDILSNEWFTKILPKSWEDENKIAGPCYRICTKCNDTL